MAHVPMDRVILHKWLKSGYMEKGSFFKTEEGTPQGGIISPVLANLALDGLERRLRAKYPLRGPGSWQGILARVHLVRYADDFIITGKSKEMLENEVKPLVESFLRERGLELSPEKTVVTHVDQGFDFLGQNVRRYNGKLLIKPSKKNIHTFLEKVREVVKKAQALSDMAGDRKSQSHVARLGDVSPSCGQQAHLQPGRLRHLQIDMAMGSEAAPSQRQALGHAEVFRTTWQPGVVLRRREEA